MTLRWGGEFEALTASGKLGSLDLWRGLLVRSVTEDSGELVVVSQGLDSLVTTARITLADAQARGSAAANAAAVMSAVSNIGINTNAIAVNTGAITSLQASVAGLSAGAGITEAQALALFATWARANNPTGLIPPSLMAPGAAAGTLLAATDANTLRWREISSIAGLDGAAVAALIAAHTANSVAHHTPPAGAGQGISEESAIALIAVHAALGNAHHAPVDVGPITDLFGTHVLDMTTRGAATLFHLPLLPTSEVVQKIAVWNPTNNNWDAVDYAAGISQVAADARYLKLDSVDTQQVVTADSGSPLRVDGQNAANSTVLELITPTSGPQKAFGAKTQGQALDWAQFGAEAGGAGKPGFTLGSGLAGRDTNLYRDGANRLRTDDAFQALTLAVEAGGLGPTQVNLGILTLEAMQDAVAAMLIGGTNVTVTYDDTAGTLTLDATGGGGGLTTEQVQDTVAALITAGMNITATYDDAAGTLTLVASDSTAAAIFRSTFLPSAIDRNRFVATSITEGSQVYNRDIYYAKYGVSSLLTLHVGLLNAGFKAWGYSSRLFAGLPATLRGGALYPPPALNTTIASIDRIVEYESGIVNNASQYRIFLQTDGDPPISSNVGLTLDIVQADGSESAVDLIVDVNDPDFYSSAPYTTRLIPEAVGDLGVRIRLDGETDDIGIHGGEHWAQVVDEELLNQREGQITSDINQLMHYRETTPRYRGLYNDATSYIAGDGVHHGNYDWTRRSAGSGVVPSFSAGAVWRLDTTNMVRVGAWSANALAWPGAVFSHNGGEWLYIGAAGMSTEPAYTNTDWRQIDLPDSPTRDQIVAGTDDRPRPWTAEDVKEAVEIHGAARLGPYHYNINQDATEVDSQAAHFLGGIYQNTSGRPFALTEAIIPVHPEGSGITEYNIDMFLLDRISATSYMTRAAVGNSVSFAMTEGGTDIAFDIARGALAELRGYALSRLVVEPDAYFAIGVDRETNGNTARTIVATGSDVAQDFTDGLTYVAKASLSDTFTVAAQELYHNSSFAEKMRLVFEFVDAPVNVEVVANEAAFTAIPANTNTLYLWA